MKQIIFIKEDADARHKKIRAAIERAKQEAKRVASKSATAPTSDKSEAEAPPQRKAA